MNDNSFTPPTERNARLFDRWSLVHIGWGLGLGWLLPPVIAFTLLVAWEPFEVLLLSPFLMKRGIVFGYEAWPNSVSDIVFDTVGLLMGHFGLLAILGTPQHVLHLFGF